MKKIIKSILFNVKVLKTLKDGSVFINRFNPLTYILIGFVFCFYFVKQDIFSFVDFVTTEQ